jgi:hypothetical protein
MVKFQSSKLAMRVRFPLPALPPYSSGFQERADTRVPRRTHALRQVPADDDLSCVANSHLLWQAARLRLRDARPFARGPARLCLCSWPCVSTRFGCSSPMTSVSAKPSRGCQLCASFSNIFTSFPSTTPRIRAAWGVRRSPRCFAGLNRRRQACIPSRRPHPHTAMHTHTELPTSNEPPRPRWRHSMPDHGSALLRVQ